jgi:hypothetical protein
MRALFFANFVYTIYKRLINEMKKQNIVRSESPLGGKFSFKNKRLASWVAAAVLVCLLFITLVPLSAIPGLGMLFGILGIAPDAARGVTLFDLAVYYAGAHGGKIAALQSAGLSARAASGLGKDGYYVSGGLMDSMGRMVFGGLYGDRLSAAEEENLKRLRNSGLKAGIAGAGMGVSGYEAEEGVYAGGAQGAQDGSAANIADPQRAAQQADFGAPLYNPRFSQDDYVAQAAGSGAAKMELAKPVVKSDMEGAMMAGKSNANGAYLAAAANITGRKMGRLGAMGGFSAQVSRAGNKGVGQMGMDAFPNMARSFALSRTAIGMGYKTAAKHAAEMAFQGGEIEKENILVPGETEEKTVSDDSLGSPNTVLQKLGNQAQACSKAQKDNQDKMSKLASEITTDLADYIKKANELEWYEKVGNVFDVSGWIIGAIKGAYNMPGTCDAWAVGICSLYFIVCGWRIPKLGGAISRRDNWNKDMDKLFSKCKEVKELEEKIAKGCGIKYHEDPEGGCDKLKEMKLKGGNKNPYSCLTDVRFVNGEKYTPERAGELLKDALKSGLGTK